MYFQFFADLNEIYLPIIFGFKKSSNIKTSRLDQVIEIRIRNRDAHVKIIAGLIIIIIQNIFRMIV